MKCGGFGKRTHKVSEYIPYQSDTTFKLFTGEVNNNDYLLTIQCAAGKCHIPSRIMCPQNTNLIQEWFDGHDKELKALTRPQNSSDPKPFKHLWDACNRSDLTTPQDPREPLPMSLCHIPHDSSDIPCPGPDRSTAEHERGLYKIRQMVLML